MATTLPATAPDLVVIDLDPADGKVFERFAGSLPGVARSRTVPFLHGRITHLLGRAVVDVAIPADVVWVIRGDRGLSWLLPEEAAPIDWAAPASGLPQASLEASIAARLGLGIGDRLTIDLFGQPHEIAVGALHAVDWTSLDLDFPILLAPPDDPPPHRLIAALWLAPEAAAGPVIAALGQRFAEAPVIAVEGVLDALGGLLAAIGATLGLATLLTLLAAGLVLAGAIAAGYRRRRQEFAILGVTGARRRQLATAGALELGLLGLAASLPASLSGSLAAFAVAAAIAPDAWRFEPAIPLAVIAAATTLLALLGWLLPRAGARLGELQLQWRK